MVLEAAERDMAEHNIKQCYLYNTVAQKVLPISPIMVTGLSQWCEDKSVIMRLQASCNLEVTIGDDGKCVHCGVNFTCGMQFIIWAIGMKQCRSMLCSILCLSVLQYVTGFW